MITIFPNGWSPEQVTLNKMIFVYLMSFDKNPIKVKFFHDCSVLFGDFINSFMGAVSASEANLEYLDNWVSKGVIYFMMIVNNELRDSFLYIHFI